MNTHVDRLARFQHGYLQALIGDLTPEQWFLQPPGVPNHPAWTVGHLAWAHGGIAAMAGQHTPIPAAWAELFGQESQPSGTPDSYPAPPELLAAYDAARDSLCDLLRTGPAQLADATPSEMLRGFFPTIGDCVTFSLTTHEAAHLGQLSVWRRALGLPPALSQLGRDEAA